MSDQAKKRGVPKGFVRPVYFVHAAVKDGILVMGTYKGQEAETAAEFKKEHGVDSEQAVGPMRRPGNKPAVAQTVKESVRLETSQMTSLTETKITGTYKGWNVIGNCLAAVKVGDTEYGANELARVIFESPVDEANKTRKPRFHINDALPVSLIENLKQN